MQTQIHDVVLIPICVTSSVGVNVVVVVGVVVVCVVVEGVVVVVGVIVVVVVDAVHKSGLVIGLLLAK